MIHDAAAVIAGFLAMAILVMAGSAALVAAFVPGGLKTLKTMRGGSDVTNALPRPPATYYALNITLSLLAAVIGGITTAHIAKPANQRLDLVGLAVLILVMGLVSASARGAQAQPRWYRILIPFIGVFGTAIVWLMVTF